MSTLHHAFAELFERARQENVLDECLQFMFTPNELESLEKRLLLIQALLKKDLTQRDMAETLNLSIAKITRGSNALKHIPPTLTQLLKEVLCTSTLI
jgi:TrpR family trp operon transcriptional repressor